MAKSFNWSDLISRAGLSDPFDIPEPGSVALMFLGLAALGLLRRRQKA